MKWKRAITVAAAGLALGAGSACGQSGDPVSGVAVQEQAQAVVAPGDGDNAPAIDNAVDNASAGVQTSKLAVSNAGELGQIVVDGEGRSVYRFDEDTSKPSKSNCAADCAAAWPPLLATDGVEIQLDGIDKTLLGTVARDDGTKQVTIGGWPAYRYVEDTQPGDVKGHGVSGTWFAFTPAGKKAASADAAKNVALVVMKVADLGPIVTDRAGMTLYRFDEDTAKPSKSNCDGECAQKWPPVLVPEGAQFELTGVDKTKVGTVVRADGTKQATLGGWPLYRFAGDTKPCDINGQGLDGTWFATKATGAKAL